MARFGVAQGVIPNECCPETKVPTLLQAFEHGYEQAADVTDVGSPSTATTLYGTATRDIAMPAVQDGMHGVARLYHARLVVDMSYPFWTAGGGDLTNSGIPVPPVSTSVLDAAKMQPRPGTMPGLYIYQPNGLDEEAYQYGSPVESGVSPSSTAKYSPPQSFVPLVPSTSSPVVFTNQLSGAQLWHFGTYIEVRHVDGSIARFDSFDPYTSTQTGTLWRVTWVKDPYDNTATYAYDNAHRLTSIAFPSGLTQRFNYAPQWPGWSSGSQLQVDYEQFNGTSTVALTGQSWGLAFGTAGPSGGSHFGSCLIRTYSAPRRILNDATGSGPYTMSGTPYVTGQIVYELDYSSAAVTESQSVHTGSAFHETLTKPSGLITMPVVTTTYNAAGQQRVSSQVNSITSASWTLTYGTGSRTSDLLGVSSLSAVTVTDSLGGQRTYEHDPASGRMYSMIMTPPDDANGRPRAHDSTNTGIGGASAGVEPDRIEVYNIFDSTCTCQKPSERQIRSTLNGTTTIRTTKFEYHSDSKLIHKRIVLNPATVPSPPPAEVTYEFTYTRAMTGSQVWGAWLPQTEITPDGTWDYVYSGWINRADAAQHGQIAGIATRRMVGVRLSVALDGSSQTSTTVGETVYRNLNVTGNPYAKLGPTGGQPRAIVDGDGVTTEFTYTANEGWLLDVIEGAVKRSYAHDAAGNVTSMTENATAASGLQAVTTFPSQSGTGVVYEAQSSSGGLLRASEYYYDRFGHIAVTRQNNLDSTGVKPSQHGGSNANARAWVESHYLFEHHRIEHVYTDRAPLDVAGQFLHTSYAYLANGQLASTTNPNGSTTDYDFDGYGTLYRTVVAAPGGSPSVSSPKSFVNPFLEVTGTYQVASGDNLWTLITRNGAGAITQIIEPKTTAPSGYSGSTGEAKHQFEIDVLGRVVEARAYAGPSGALLTKREMRYDQLSRQNWQNDHVLGFGSGSHYSVWRYTGSKLSQLASVERSGIGSTGYVYDSTTGLLDQVTDGAGNQVGYGYYANTTYLASLTRTDQEPGSGTRVTATLYEVDPFGRVTKIRDGGNLDHVYAYNSFGRVDRYTDPMGKVQKFLPDALGRIVEHVRLDGSGGYIHNSTVFTDSGQSDGRTKVARQDGIGNETITHNDFVGRPFIVQNPGGDTVPTSTVQNQSMCLYAEYDDASRIKAVYDGDGGKTEFWRDGPGRVIQRELAKHGALISLWNTKEVMVRDAIGRMSQMKIYGSLSVGGSGVPDHALLVATESFDADSIGRTHAERYAFTFAPANVLEVNSAWAGGSPVRDGLDYADNLGSGLTAPLSMDYGHDAIGRLTGIDWTGHSGSTSTLAGYEWVGGLRRNRTVRYSASNYPEGKTTYGYDGYNRLTQIKDDIYTAGSTFTTKSQFDYVYDAASNLVKEEYIKVDGSAGDRFAYDAYHRLTEAWMGVDSSLMTPSANPTGFVSGQMHSYLTYGLDSANNRTDSGVQTGSSPVTTSYALQDGNHPQGASNRYDGVGVGGALTPYEYDGRGNLTCDGVFVFRYDYLNRLQEVWKIVVDGETQEDAQYAVATEGAEENARTQVRLSVQELTRRLPREHMNSSFRAQLRANIAGGVIKINGRGQGGGGGMPPLLIDAQVDLVAVYGYDAFNRRVMGIIVGVETQFHTWDGWRQVVQYKLDDAQNPDAAVPTKQFVWGSRLDELLSYRRKNGSSWENYFLLHGGQDTAAKLVDSVGAVVEQYEYDPYGKASVYVGSSTTAVGESSVGLPFLWKGIRCDGETELLYMRNRYYSTRLGRMLSRDLLGNWGDVLNGGNGYAYVGERPLSLGDPMGLQGDAGPTVVASGAGGSKLGYSKGEGLEKTNSGESVPSEMPGGGQFVSGGFVVEVTIWRQVTWYGTSCGGMSWTAETRERVDQVRMESNMEGAAWALEFIALPLDFICLPLGVACHAVGGMFGGAAWGLDPDKYEVWVETAGGCEWFEGSVTEELYATWEIVDVAGPGDAGLPIDDEFLVDRPGLSGRGSIIAGSSHYSGPIAGGIPPDPGARR